MNTKQTARSIYQAVWPTVDSKSHQAEHQGRIEDWLNDGDLDDNPSVEELVTGWREFDQPAERD